MWSSRVYRVVQNCRYNKRRPFKLVVLAAISLSTVSGFISGDEKRNKIHSPFVYRPSVLTCQSSFENNHVGHNHAVIDLSDSSHYQLLPKPKQNTHAIYGALMQPHLVEQYDTFKNLKFSEGKTQDDDVVVAKVKIGNGLDGHPSIVHGGILSLLIDDTLGAAYYSLGTVNHAVTANLNVNYRKSVMAGSTFLVRCKLVERVRRKLVWEIVIECPDTGSIYCEATSLFVIPRKFAKEQLPESS